MATERQKILAALYNDTSLTTKDAAEKAGIQLRPFMKSIKRIRDAGEIELVDRKNIKSTDHVERKVASKSLDIVEEHRLKREKRQLSSQIREMAEQQERDSRLERMLDQFTAASIERPEWMEPKSTKRRHSTAVTMLSDTHFDEVVKASEMNYVNAYNRRVADLRLETYFSNVITLDKDYMTGVKNQGLVMALGGDLVSGDIHDELAITNEAACMSTALYWSARLAEGIERLVRHYGRVHVPVVTGNHGRTRRKPNHKFRAESNWDYLIAHLVARELKHLGDKLTWNIPVTSDVKWKIYQWRFQMTHGDQFKGGNGIAGVMSPIMRGDARKRNLEEAVGTPYHYLMMGHFHQLQNWGDKMINGSLKGYDDYAIAHAFGFELPQQMFFLVDPEHGKTIWSPVRVTTEAERRFWDKPVGERIDWLSQGVSV